MAALLAAHAFGPIPAAQAHSGCAELAATVSKATYVQESPYHEIVQKLVDLIEANGWQADFEAAIQNAQAHEVPAIGDVRTLDDYLNFVNLTRGLVVIDSPIGLVACLPMGMAQVSSVVLTAEVGTVLHKGEELGYFQFGGSDFVMVFERASNVQLIGQPDVHYSQGSWIGTAFPYTFH